MLLAHEVAVNAELAIDAECLGTNADGRSRARACKCEAVMRMWKQRQAQSLKLHELAGAICGGFPAFGP